jgi:hypothetical protein
MQGMTLLLTFLAAALVSVAIASTIGIILDNFPNVHDLLSVLGFFGSLCLLLPAAWVLSVRLTAPKEPETA